MESKNVKVIDEHNIDRDANVICSVDVDGTDYVIYSIERDAENDNVFVSKLIKNNDGTSNMVNIDDSIEKNKLNDIIKELITYSINSEDDKTTGTVTLSDGKNVNISSVLFNKEQRINVNKTYITTVKKSVTKVSGIFYKIDKIKIDTEPVIESIFDAEQEEKTAVVEKMPVVKLENDVVNTVVPQPIVEAVSLPNDSAVVQTESENVKSTLPENETSSLNTVSPVAEINIPAPEVVPMPMPSVTVSPVEVVPSETVTASTVVPMSQPVGEIKSEPITVDTPSTAVYASEMHQPVVSNTVVPSSDNKLVFDASKETNLNVALGEVSSDKTIQVENVSPIREFGIDEPIVQNNVAPTEEIAVQDNQLVRTRTMGFANNKFFMVVAIVFFVAACVFLGYEVFRYFSIVGQ